MDCLELTRLNSLERDGKGFEANCDGDRSLLSSGKGGVGLARLGWEWDTIAMGALMIGNEAFLRDLLFLPGEGEQLDVRCVVWPGLIRSESRPVEALFK